MYFFFFQAEDGIRDIGVTGVQTCALPILIKGCGFRRRHRLRPRNPHPFITTRLAARPARTGWRPTKRKSLFCHQNERRSEERRVGKECRSRGSTYHKKKNNDERRRQRALR